MEHNGWIFLIVMACFRIENINSAKVSKLCDNTVCPPGQNCVLVADFPFHPHAIIPVCVDPCQGISCPVGEYCYVDFKNCNKTPCELKAVCKNPCDKVKCSGSKKCYLTGVRCTGHPCNPIATCGDPCDDVICPIDNACSVEKGLPVCKNPCSSVKCRPGEICYIQHPSCNGERCEDPVAVCNNPCESIVCAHAQKCYLQEVKCVTGLCHPFPVCV